MSRVTKKAAAVIVTAGLVVTVAFGSIQTNIKAENIYDDSNIGLSTALDRYVETVCEEETKLNESLSQSDSSSNTTTEDTEEVSSESTEDVSTESTTSEDTTEAAEDTTTCKYPQFEDRCLTTVTTSVNIRSEASEESEIVGTLAASGIALVKEKGDEWTKIASGTCEGYIKNDYLVFGDEAGEYAEEHCTKLATITTETLKVREEADGESACVTMVPGGESYVVLDVEDGWVEIKVDDDASGYVSAEYVDITFDTVRAVSVEEAEAAAEAARQAEEAAAKAAAESTSSSSSSNSSSSSSSSSSNSSSSSSSSSSNSSSSSSSSSSNSSSSSSSSSSNSSSSSSSSSDSSSSSTTVASSGSLGVDVANYALQFVGNPYVYGGSSLTNGTDCSGFTMSVYAHFGYSLPHSSSAQSTYGTEVSLSELEPGDLLFYNNGGGIGHVAIYIGNGMVVHASSPETGIKTSAYNYRTVAKAVRIIG